MDFTGHIDSFKSVWFNEHTALLPRVAVNVSDGQTSLLLTGWLPFHHRSVTYVLRITTPRQGKARILEVVSVTRKDLKDSSSIPSTFTKMKRVARLSEFAYKEYIARTKAAYASGPLWRLCTLYSYWRLKDMDLVAADAAIAARLLTLCDRESLWCHRDVMYHTGRARRLLQKGAAVYNMPFDVQAFDTLMDWQRATMTDTAVRVRPEHSPEGLQCYQGKWTSSAEIARAKTIGQAFAHANALLGSPCPSNIPEDAIVWVRCLEDAYRWKCWVDWGRLCLLELPGPELRARYGLTDVQPIKRGTEPVYIAWAHLWGVEEWCAVAPFVEKRTVTCIGRLDQWPRGRGQVFRDLTTVRHTRTYHRGCENVMQAQTDDVRAYVACLCQKHPLVQCFADAPEDWSSIDTGRLWVSGPRRIRTVCTRQAHNIASVYEEAKPQRPYTGTNASVIKARAFHGLPIPVSVYLCGPETKAFDVHVARTHTRDLFIVLNCTTCLFVFEHRTPKKVTIHPFL